MLFPSLAQAGTAPAVRFGDDGLSHRELRDVAANVAAEIGDAGRVAVWATSTLHTCAAIFGALAAGVAVVPISPKAGTRELEHMAADAAPDLLFADPGAELPAAVQGVVRATVAFGSAGHSLPPEPAEDAPALIIYTSGTTGLPKGVVLSRRDIAANLDALAAAWAWTAEDRLVHALPLLHVHSLALGLLGPIRLGGQVRHLQRFSAAAVATALEEGATMLFGVPTMYHRTWARRSTVADAAVTAEPDVDLGERIVAWVVLRPEAGASAEELVAHVSELLSPHKRPRAVHFLDELPRNDMGKIRQTEPTAATAGGDR